MPIILSLVWGSLSKFFGAAFTFLTTKPGVYVLIAVLAVGSLWYSNHRGYERAKTEDAAAAKLAIAKAEKLAADQARKDQIRLDAGMAAASERTIVLREKAKTITLTITKEIPTYVTVEVDRAFPLPCGLFRLHDAAALGVAPQAISLPTGFTDEVACEVKASVLSDIIVENYGLYHEAEAQIIGLQELAKTLKATIEGTE